MYIFRPHYSSYWPTNYRDLENNNYQNMPLKKISGQEDFPKQAAPWILLSNSQFKKEFVPTDWWQSLALIIHSNSGHDSLDVVREEINKKSIPVILGNELRQKSVVQYYLQCLMDAWGEIPWKQEWDKRRQFERTLIWRKKILIYGNGHIGKLLASILTLLGAEVFSIDPLYPTLPKFEGDLKNIDAVLLCCSLTDSSYHLVNQVFLEKFSENLVIINAARGKVICEEGLISILKRRPNWKIFLDVFEKEPADFQKWPKAKENGSVSQVKLSSHVAGVYRELPYESLKFEFDILSHFFSLSQTSFLEKYKAQLWHP